METLKLNSEEIRHIALFESITGAITKDCIVDNNNNKVTFIVKKGDMGLAIGRRGANVQKIRQLLGKKIEVIEHSDDPKEFIRNLFRPLRVRDVTIVEKAGKKIARVDVDDRDRALAIGKGGKNIQKVKYLAKRHHKIDDVIVL
ncbi:MAG: NusA-like transcription termination signal-binding factor [Candidatus Hydrothermarchaeota archaeon]|nr:MAG: NusA-like transcription termination signal-binding factor [Candidatus Hydrothermarchaeota archaeon]RLG57482.1 MAG: NusA-like transcription termination signal-binding factor [Candidatus Hydrothermarchaeota archaeon]